MGIVAFFVGLDYHQDGVQLCVMDGGGQVLGNRKVKNQVAAITAAVRRLGRPATMR